MADPDSFEKNDGIKSRVVELIEIVKGTLKRDGESVREIDDDILISDVENLIRKRIKTPPLMKVHCTVFGCEQFDEIVRKTLAIFLFN